MKKKVLFLTLSLLVSLIGAPKVWADEEEVPLDTEVIDPTLGEGGNPRSPINPPHASIDDHTFYVNSSHADFVVYLVDENEQVVYCTLMPSNVSSINLPTYLVGTYRIELLTGNWLFYGYITL